MNNVAEFYKKNIGKPFLLAPSQYESLHSFELTDDSEIIAIWKKTASRDVLVKLISYNESLEAYHKYQQLFVEYEMAKMLDS